MKRLLCCLAVFALLALPDWASACRPLWGRWIPRPMYGPPMYSQPVQCAPAYPVYPPAYAQPVYPAPRRTLPPPRIETIPKAATPTPAPAPGDAGAIDTNTITRPGVIENLRPVAGSDSAPPPKPADMNPPKKADPPKVDPPAIAPDPLPKFPEVVIPKDIGPLPKLEVPKGATADPKKAPAVPDPAPAPDLKLPPIEFPRDTGPKPPGPGASAAPMAAPPAPEPLIPSPAVPVIPDPAKKDSLPSLTLPPDVPIMRESKSSPLTGGRREMTVSVFPAGGDQAVRGGYRTVGFYNHTARDLNLTIEGRAVKLPARTYLHAQLAATFTWGHGDRPLVRETVPDGAAGVDVVFRE